MCVPDIECVHDGLLLGYAIRCADRTISLEVKRPNLHGVLEVTFTGVEAYHFQDDAFGTILFEIEATPAVELFHAEASQIRESFRRAGAPGPWAHSELDALTHIRETRVRGFRISSSVGLSGWLLARDITSTLASSEAAS